MLRRGDIMCGGATSCVEEGRYHVLRRGDIMC